MSVALPGASLAALAGAPPNGPLPETNLVEWVFSSPFGPGGSGVSYGGSLGSPGRHLDGPVAPTKPIFVDARTGAQLSRQRLYADTLRYASGLRHLLGLLPTPVPGSSRDASPIVSPVVLMHSPNCLAFVPIMLGIHAAQLCVCVRCTSPR